MSQHQKPTDFEERLLTRLQGVIAERSAEAAEAEAALADRPPRSRVPRLAMGGAVAAAAVTAGLIVSAGGDNAPAAYAVESQPGGGVSIEIYSLSEADGLETALAEAGVPSQVNYLPAGMTCREPHFETAEDGTRLRGGFDIAGPEPLKISIGDPERASQVFHEWSEEWHSGEITDDEYYSRIGNIYLNPAEFDSDKTLVLTGSPSPYDGDPTGGSTAEVRVAEGEVGPCEPVTAATAP